MPGERCSGSSVVMRYACSILSRMRAPGGASMGSDKKHSTLPTLKALYILPQGLTGYISAGVGSLIIQVVLASLLGGLFVLKVYWRRVKAFVTRRSYEPPEKVKGEDKVAAEGEAAVTEFEGENPVDDEDRVDKDE